jgi:6-phosphogluconolactonase/glucosamine-6-phosphate isomerase/deaminase
VVENDGERVVPPARVTMTYPLINAARYLSVLVSGEKKRGVLSRIATPERRAGVSEEELPILGVRPVGGVLKWFIDHDACPAD